MRLLAQKGPFSHITTITTSSQEVLAKLESKFMRSGNTFEYKGKTYRYTPLFSVQSLFASRIY